MKIYEKYQEHILDQNNQNIIDDFIILVDNDDDKSYHLVKGEEDMKFSVFVQVNGNDDYSGIETYAKDFFESHPNAFFPMECFVSFYDDDKDKPDKKTYKKFLKYLKSKGFKYDKNMDELI